MIEKSTYEETPVKLSEEPAKPVNSSAEQPDFLKVTPHQFVRAKSGKYVPTVRPNFWIPIILLFASIIPFIGFGFAFTAVKGIQLIPVHYMTDPTNPIKIWRLFANLTFLLIPSMVGALTALYILKMSATRAISVVLWATAVILTSIYLLLLPLEF